MRTVRYLAAALSSSATCLASSRVGRITRAWALPEAGSSSQPSSPGPRVSISSGMPKPRVLPVPVLAWPIMSAPSSATGRVKAWIGKGWVMPRSSRALVISSSTPYWAKVLVSKSRLSAVALMSASTSSGRTAVAAAELIRPVFVASMSVLFSLIYAFNFRRFFGFMAV